MSRASKTNPHQPEFALELGPPVIQPVAGGAFLVKPGKPILVTPDITVARAAQLLGKSVSTIHRYITEGLLTAKQIKPKARITLARAEVDALRDRLKHEDS